MVSESTRLSAQDWARAALKAIAEGGLAAVGVEPLARTLGVTKGSFYAHYRNRDELITAALEEWERSHGDEGLAAIRRDHRSGPAAARAAHHRRARRRSRWRRRCT